MSSAPSSDEFREWLTHERGLATRTAEVYSQMIDFGRKRGDVLLAVRKARTKGSLRVATAAVRLWGNWTRDTRLVARATQIARRRDVGETIVKHVTEEERTGLVNSLPRVEEPYQSAMTVVILSGLRLATILDLSRTQAEIGCSERIPIIGPHGDVLGYWLAPTRVQEAFCTLLQYGGWERMQDLFGRDYLHAYKQIRILLRYLSRKSGIRSIRPTEMVRPGSPMQAPGMLDAEARCA